jgi:hypothetical protein
MGEQCDADSASVTTWAAPPLTDQKVAEKMVCACDSRHDTGMAFFGNLQEKFV